MVMWGHDKVFGVVEAFEGNPAEPDILDMVRALPNQAIHCALPLLQLGLCHPNDCQTWMHQTCPCPDFTLLCLPLLPA
jgi:hypothetical protein